MQRPLKLAQYLPALGIETHVLAPDDPKWVHRDPDLRVPTQAWVHRVRYVGPKARKPAEELRGGRWARAGVASGSGDCPPAARPRRECDLESHRDPRGDPHRPARGDRRRHDDVASRLDPLRRRRRQAGDGCALACRPSRPARRQPTAARGHCRDPGSTSGERAARPARRPPRRCDLMRFGRDRRGGARARPARNRPHDRERLRLRRLRGPRVPAGAALPDHARRKLLREARPASVPAGAARLRRRRASPGSSATSAAPIESGPSRSGSETGSS